MTTAVILSDDDFLEKMEACVEEEGNLAAIRSLLWQSPCTLSVFVEHSQLLGMLLDRTNEEPLKQVNSEDPLLLAAYVTMVLQYPMHELMAERESYFSHHAGERITKPMYTALTSVMGFLSTAEGLGWAHPTLHTAMEKKLLEPTVLLDHLLTNMEQQIIHSKGDDAPDSEFDMKAIISETALGSLLYALRPSMLDLQWTPDKEEYCQYLWMVHEGLSLFDHDGGEPRAVSFLQTLLQHPQTQLQDALAFLSRKFSVRTSLVNAFFPLSLERGEPVDILRNIVKIVIDDERNLFPQKAADFMNGLHQWHPQLEHLLCLHQQLYPEAAEAMTNADVMVPAFERLRGSAPSVMAVDSTIFMES